MEFTNQTSTQNEMEFLLLYSFMI